MTQLAQEILNTAEESANNQINELFDDMLDYTKKVNNRTSRKLLRQFVIAYRYKWLNNC